jgi:hypothetical protein
MITIPARTPATRPGVPPSPSGTTSRPQPASPGGGPLLNLNGQVHSRGISRTGYDGLSSHTGAARLAAGRQQTA